MMAKGERIKGGEKSKDNRALWRRRSNQRRYLSGCFGRGGESSA
jgi:hypothetical protein